MVREGIRTIVEEDMDMDVAEEATRTIATMIKGEETMETTKNGTRVELAGVGAVDVPMAAKATSKAESSSGQNDKSGWNSMSPQSSRNLPSLTPGKLLQN